ncbi:hypothetical protein FisN_13Lh089 [Fistulifera solaris]|uniref:Uncharacterized protein n=1 Tax=Fistulifera solaris TaxID=1519565 RepID=A0A1Z5JF43_FISSO|nr:hypothetical protein FisN_13Lh089 [Fistulifera solaris]|eukprot:GAX12623.1 hypothetical protein FisN_13Lh089 [Fistulifera solaris]
MSESISYHPKISDTLRKFLNKVLGEETGKRIINFNTPQVAQLKQILSILYRMPFVYECKLNIPLKLSFHKRKEQFITTVCSILYDDFPNCQSIRSHAESGIRTYLNVQERIQARVLQQGQQHHTTAVATAANTANTAAASAQVALPPSQFPTPPNPQAYMIQAYAQQLQNQLQTTNTCPCPCTPAMSPKSSVANKKSSTAKKLPPKPATPSKRPIPAVLSPRPFIDTVRFLPSNPSSPAAGQNQAHTANLTANSVHAVRSPTPSSKKEKSSSRPRSPPKSKKVKVKTEPRNDDDGSSSITPQQQSAAASHHDSTPQNPREHMLTAELLAMGFTDRSEILWSIRKLSRSFPLAEVTCENVMLDIISNREETDEARKMDEARMLSERTRKQESKRLRLIIAQNQYEERKKATWSEWLSRSDMYARSWLLTNAGVKESLEQRVHRNMQVKEALMEILDLEKKSRKWYGQALPRAYFRGTLAQQISSKVENHSTAEQVLGFLKSEIVMLKEAMFTLSVQQGGVPKLFVDALDSPTLVSGDDSDKVDEEIVVVRVEGGFGPDKGLSTPKLLCKQQVVPHTPDVIEIE